MNNQEQLLEKLIEEIGEQINRPDTAPIFDGVYDWDMYHDAPIQVMVVMKEPYDEIDENGNGFGGGWYITKDCFGKDDAWKNRSWQPLIYILYGLFNGKRYEEMDYIRNDKSMADVLKSIAYINTNKMPALTQTNDSELQANYEIWKPVLFKQIEIFNPQVILFVNTFKLYKKDLVGESCQSTSISPNGSVHVYVSNGRILLDAYHPNQKTYGHSIYVNEIIDAIRNALNN
jgi:hypothetical protein